METAVLEKTIIKPLATVGALRAAIGYATMASLITLSSSSGPKSFRRPCSPKTSLGKLVRLGSLLALGFGEVHRAVCCLLSGTNE